MGRVFAHDGVDPHSSFTDRVLKFAHAHGVDVILAYAIAHEFDHVLLPAPAHTKEGLMKAE
jgi:hypothetical protein